MNSPVYVSDEKISMAFVNIYKPVKKYNRLFTVNGTRTVSQEEYVSAHCIEVMFHSFSVNVHEKSYSEY